MTLDLDNMTQAEFDEVMAEIKARIQTYSSLSLIL